MQALERFITSAPAEGVWQTLADLEHWKDWNPTIVAIVPLTEEGLRVGARYRVTQHGLRSGIYKVTHCTPNKSFTWIQKVPGGQLIADHRISAKDGATEVELSFCSKGLPAHLVTMLLSGKIREFVAKEALGLKAASQGFKKSNVFPDIHLSDDSLPSRIRTYDRLVRAAHLLRE